MDCTVREKHIRTNRRTRLPKPESDQSTAIKTYHVDKLAVSRLGNRSKFYETALSASDENQKHGSCSSSGFDESGWGYCTEEQLEEILLKNLEFLYKEAIGKFVGLGYSEDVALKAILSSRNCFGGMDVLTNILHNCLAYLNGSAVSDNGSNKVPELEEPAFSDLRQLQEYSLTGMICLLQQVKPHLSKGDAMWCLLMSDLHVARASMMEIPLLPSPTSSESNSTIASGSSLEGLASNGGPVGIPPSLCKFHGGWGFGSGGSSEFPVNGFLSCASEMALRREIEFPKRLDLSPSMKTLLKQNVAMFAAGLRANSKQFNWKSHTCSSPSNGSESSNGCAAAATVNFEDGKSEDLQSMKNQDVVNAVMDKFQDLNLDENKEPASLDPKDQMILTLLNQIKDLENKVKEQKEWAHQKAMQAARKLSHDLSELKTLRMEREEALLMNKGKEVLEDNTIKQLSEMENNFRKASGQVDRANAAARKLEIENAEIRAEMEASNLSASESLRIFMEIAKREKKSRKKFMALEKQKIKMQDDVSEVKQKILALQNEIKRVELATKDAEAKLKNEEKVKESAFEQLEEERRLKDASELNNKRKLEAVRQKIEIDFQRHKDDVQRLEQEHERLKESSQCIKEHDTNGHSGEKLSNGSPRKLQLEEAATSPEKVSSSYDRECMICKKDEVCVVFLPCRHQVICGNCNENNGKKGKAALCPCCRVPIEQRIRVYGASL